MNYEQIINNIQKEIKKDLKSHEIDEVFGRITDQFIRLYAEGITREKERTAYWKNKAYILFQYQNIARKECPEHDTHIERSFNPWEKIKATECLTCEAQAKINQK